MGRDGRGKVSARFDPKSGKRDQPMTKEMAQAKAAGLIAKDAPMPTVDLVPQTPPATDPASRGLLDPGYCLEFRRSIGEA